MISFFGCIFLVSCCYCYCCSYCEAYVSVWARISTLYGFNTVVVVGPLASSCCSYQ